MGRKKKPLPLLEKITITDVAAEGKAIAKVDGLAVFVPYVVPGDIVDLQVRRKNIIMQKQKQSAYISIPMCALCLSANTSECAGAVSGSVCPMKSNFDISKNRWKTALSVSVRLICRQCLPL